MRLNTGSLFKLAGPAVCEHAHTLGRFNGGDQACSRSRLSETVQIGAQLQTLPLQRRQYDMRRKATPELVERGEVWHIDKHGLKV